MYCSSSAQLILIQHLRVIIVVSYRRCVALQHVFTYLLNCSLHSHTTKLSKLSELSCSQARQVCTCSHASLSQFVCTCMKWLLANCQFIMCMAGYDLYNSVWFMAVGVCWMCWKVLRELLYVISSKGYTKKTQHPDTWTGKNCHVFSSCDRGVTFVCLPSNQGYPSRLYIHEWIIWLLKQWSYFWNY